MADHSPVKLVKRRKVSTNWSKCVICQKSDGLSKAKTSSIETLLKAGKVRDDLVSERLNSDLDDLFEKKMFWHLNCYKSYTSTVLI